VTARQSGLRFDIYERVHLADDTVGVKELDEVELVPHIQVYTEGEQAFLKGNLYLTGSYTGEAGEGSRILEHLIPVEITLPLNRIQDLAAVSVDIDNFDVDLLSSRSLNVTGVLTLHGIEMLPVPEEQWREEEETVFVSRAGQFGDISPAVPQPSADQEEAYSPSYRLQDAEEPAFEAALSARGEEEPQQETVAEIFVNADEVDEEDESLEVVEDIAEDAVEPNAPPVKEQPAPEVQEEKKELKIAFGSKQSTDPSYHLKSLIHKGDMRSQGGAAAAEKEEAAQTPRTDALEWKRLFARSEGEEQKFSRVRVCIVQKEESLETIAERYRIKPQEILQYNHVNAQELAEGKVLFIPR
jgi:stage VI sporulation protein D